MAAFVVVATKRPANAIATRLRDILPATAFLQINDLAWLVSYEGTSRSLAEALGIRQGETGGGIVLKASNYSGRAATEVWEWLAEQSDKGSE